MADVMSSGPPADYRPVFYAPFCILFAISLLTSVARIYWRCRPERLLKWDDYMLVAALLLTVGTTSLMFVLYAHGRGVEGLFDPSANGPILAAQGLMWLWALNTVRISMALMLLRLKDSTQWQWPLWVLIGVQVCLIIVATTMLFSYCRPFSGSWNPTPDTVCISPSSMKLYAFVYNAFNIASDFIIAILPLTFIWKMHRSRAEKILLVGLMAAGLAAAAVAIVRLITVIRAFGVIPPASLDVKMDLMIGVELFLILTAANLPCLKGPLHRCLVRFGVVVPSNPVHASPSSFLHRLPNGSGFLRQIRALSLPTWNDSRKSSSGAISNCTAAVVTGNGSLCKKASRDKEAEFVGDQAC
ncbi:hypothetical protein ACJ41O_010326 [Fusarium nematophilum]